MAKAAAIIPAKIFFDPLSTYMRGTAVPFVEVVFPAPKPNYLVQQLWGRNCNARETGLLTMNFYILEWEHYSRCLETQPE